jgi:hypothetical protein
MTLQLYPPPRLLRLCFPYFTHKTTTIRLQQINQHIHLQHGERSSNPTIKKTDSPKESPRRSPATPTLATSLGELIQDAVVDAVMIPILQEMQSSTYVQQIIKRFKQIPDKLNIQLSRTSIKYFYSNSTYPWISVAP